MRLRHWSSVALLLLLSLTGVAYADRAKDQSERLDEILRLVREDVSDAVIVKHIEASGFVYDLSADDILELRQLGMSDVVIEALLDTAIRDDGSNRRHRNDYDDEDSSLSVSVSAGYFSPWYWYPYAWGFYYDPFPACYSAYYYPFRYGHRWGYYGYAHHYYYRNFWPYWRYDNPRYFDMTRRHQGASVRVSRMEPPRRTHPMGTSLRSARAVDRPLPPARQPQLRPRAVPEDSGARRRRQAAEAAGR